MHFGIGVKEGVLRLFNETTIRNNERIIDFKLIKPKRLNKKRIAVKAIIKKSNIVTDIWVYTVIDKRTKD